MNAPKATAEGTLARSPLAHVLLTVLDRKLSGTLAIWPDPDATEKGQDRVLFHNGKIVRARPIIPAGDLARALLPAMRRTQAPYAFYETDLVGEGDGVIEGLLHPHALIAAAVRGGARKDATEDVLRRLGKHHYRLKRSVDVSHLELIRKETAFVEMLQAAPATVAELISTSGDERTARRVLYLLAITKQIEPTKRRASSQSVRPPSAPPADAPAAAGPSNPPGAFDDLPTLDSLPPPPGAEGGEGRRRKRGSNLSMSLPGTPEPPPPPPAELSDAHRAHWEDVASKLVASDTQNLFQLLGVGTDATDEAIRTAYFERAKTYHPDRLAPELSGLRHWADRLFQMYTEAEKVLTDPDKRSEHFKAVQDGGGTPASDRELTMILGAAMEFQKVEVLERRREWDEAMALLEDILDIAPNEPDYIAMNAWILLQRDGDKARKRVRQLAEEALELREDHERALHTMAHLLKRIGQDSLSREYFERVVEANPKNMDAVRELRLANMRQGKGKKKKGSGSGDDGFLGKLFGSKKK